MIPLLYLVYQCLFKQALLLFVGIYTLHWEKFRLEFYLRTLKEPIFKLKAEERYNKYPFSQKEFIEETPTERLYSRILPEMAEYVIAILKVILASLPSSKVIF